MKQYIRQLDRSISWSWLPDIVQYTVEQAKAIQSIPAPTFHEEKRAHYVAATFQQFGLAEISVDSLYNVYGLLKGQQPDLPGVMVSAHTDTVFPADTELALSEENHRIYGPGLGDNSIGVSGLLGLLAALKREDTIPWRNIWFVATTREEGMGDLGGIKAAFKQLQPHIHCVINLEGLAFGHIYHSGIAVRRLKITASAPGGHSWLHFGRPSATHAIIELGGRILSIRPPEVPRTTYNVGLLDGGQGINVIATKAELWLDMRSEQVVALHQLEQEVSHHIQALTTSEIKFEVEVVGDRPAGSIDARHQLVQDALAALAQVGVQGALETGSTDANVPLAAGCPAVTIGITRGGNAHRLDEYVDTLAVEQGIRQLILLTLAAANSSIAYSVV